MPIDYAKRARRVLDAINKERKTFDMGAWVRVPGGEISGPITPYVEPGGELACGTTMCVAGWGAHLGGWTLDTRNQIALKVSREDGINTADARTTISEAGQEWLGLPNDQLFYMDNEDALIALEELAKGRSWFPIYDDYSFGSGAFSPAARMEREQVS